MEFVPIVAMTALIVKLIDFLRYAVARDRNGVATQITAWAGGVIVFLLVAQTAWADGIPIGSRPLSRLSVWSLVFAGMTLGSMGSVIKDTLKSVDNHNSSVIPTLLPPGPSNGIQAAPTGQVPGDVG